MDALIWFFTHVYSHYVYANVLKVYFSLKKPCHIGCIDEASDYHCIDMISPQSYNSEGNTYHTGCMQIYSSRLCILKCLISLLFSEKKLATLNALIGLLTIKMRP
ncbi:unnamed protein product, partial [Meganyctiphanes norvegica]